MTHNTTPTAPASRFFKQMSLSILLPFFRKKNFEPESYPVSGTSVFSRPDPNEQFALEEDICPLVEAEVYVIFGRDSDAVRALAKGLTNGRITIEQVASFWANQHKLPVRSS